MAQNKVTQKQFNEFKAAFEVLVDILNLRDWEVYYELGGCAPDAVASVQLAPSDRYMTVRMAKDWGEANQDPVGCACHEAFHAFIGTYEMLAFERFVQCGALNLENERMARVMERILPDLVRPKLDAPKG